MGLWVGHGEGVVDGGHGQWSMVNGQWSMVNGQWLMGNGQRAMGIPVFCVGNWQLTIDH
jgi:hypothetical protein